MRPRFGPDFHARAGSRAWFVRGLDVDRVYQADSYPLPSELAGVSVRVDGIPAPLLAVAPLPETGTQQIHFQVPFQSDLEPCRTVMSRVVHVCFPANGPPGIFVHADGTVVAQRADYSVVSAENPARAGEVITIYGTGLGPVRPPVPTGDAATVTAGVAIPVVPDDRLCTSA